jgi:Tol biopolymer transport system component
MRATVKLGGLAALAAGLVRCSLVTSFSGLEGDAASSNDGGPASDGSLADGGVELDGGGPGVDGAVPDASPRTVCDPRTPFGAPVPVTEVNTPSDDTGARLTQDELSIYFASTRNGDFDLFRMTRSSRMAQFASATKLSELNTPMSERSPSPKGDDLALMFDSDREGGVGGRDLYLGTRDSTKSAYTKVLGLGTLNSSSDDSRCNMLPSALTVYFESDRGGSGHIYRATRSSLADSFSAPVLLTELASSSEDGYPVPSVDETVVYFGSARAGGAGNFDIWRATRASNQVPFDAPVRVTELATVSDDIPTWLSADMCRLYFMSDRAGGMGNLDIYVARRSP